MKLLFNIGGSGQSLSLTKPVLEHFEKWRQDAHWKTEAGGQLFGVNEGPHIIIKKATGPRQADHRSRVFFIADRASEIREIRKLHKLGLHYLGDWHTHPEDIPRPSATDITSMRDIFTKSTHELHAFVMIIIGRENFPSGLHVSIHEQNFWAKLDGPVTVYTASL